MAIVPTQGVSGWGNTGEVIGSALQSAYNAVTPQVWRGDYAPEAWANWYTKRREPGAPEREAYEEYKRRLEPVFAKRFAEYVRALPPELKRDMTLREDPANKPGLAGWQAVLSGDATAAQAHNRKVMHLVSTVKAGLVGDPHDSKNEEANWWRLQFLDWMRDTSLGGDKRTDNSVTPEQYAEWDKLPGEATTVIGRLAEFNDALDRRFRLTEEGQNQRAKLADYNLMKALQTDPSHRPEYLKGGALSLVQNLAGGPVSQTARKTLADLVSGDPLAAVRNAIMRDDMERKAMQEDPEFFNRGLTGSTIPQFSALTPTGLSYKSESGGTGLGQATRSLTNPILFLDKSAQDRQAIADTQTRLKRVTPIIAPAPQSQPRQESGDEREMTTYDAWINGRQQREFGDAMALSSAISSAEADRWKAPAAYAPLLAHKWNEANDFWLGQNRGDITPGYLPAAVNDALMTVPAIAGDPQNVAQSALFGGFGLALGQGRRAVVNVLKQNLAEAPSEAGYGTAIQLSNTPQSWTDYLNAPDPGVFLRTKDGRIPDPTNRQEYQQAVDDYESQLRNTLRDASEFLYKQNSRTKPGASPVSPKPFQQR